jgi:pSer/pThr/pTyr-binding forkhead associated (FHA) protein
MPKLIVKRKAEIIDEFVFDESKSAFMIGSDLDNDFIILDKKVSLKHLRIEKINDAFYLEDLKSAFGTHLNGRPVLNRVQIVDGDEISIADIHIVFDNISRTNFRTDIIDDEEIELIDDSDFENGISLDDFKKSKADSKHLHDALVADNAGLKATTEEFYEIEEVSEGTQTEGVKATDTDKEIIAKSTGRSYYLLAIYGPYLGKKYALNFGDTKIGRDAKLNDIILRKNEKGELDPSISRRHATVSFKNGSFSVTDKRSKTRTYVNQTKLNPSDEVPLNVKDEIEIVSDRKSTIFRLLAHDEIDFSPPKKAGVWWVRNKHRLFTVLSVLLGIIALLVMGRSIKVHSDIGKRPNPLKVFEEIWYQTNDDFSNAKLNGIDRKSLVGIGNLALADLTGDKNVDLIFSDLSGRLVALDGKSKNILWENQDIRVQNTISIVLTDLNENGLADVLVVGNDSRLRALDGSNGAEIWLSPILGESLSGPPVVSDLDGDGLKDISVASKAGQIHIGYGNIYTINWKTIQTGFPALSVASSWDWDSDGKSEVFIGTEEGKVLVIDGNTEKVVQVFDFNEGISKATGNLIRLHSIRNPVALTDINQNSVVDLLISSTSGNYLAVEGESFSRIWYEQLTLSTYSNGENLPPTLGDVDGDKIDDVVLVASDLIRIIKGSADPQKSKQVLWEFNLESTDVFVTPATLADVNKDNRNDIIIGSKLGTVYILSGENGEVLAQVNDEGNPAISPPLVADMDADGFMDILLIRKDYDIYRIQTNSSIRKNSVIWGQVYGNAQHTSRLSYKRPNTLSHNLYFAGSGFLLFGVILLNFAVRKKRQQLILRNQSPERI